MKNKLKLLGIIALAAVIGFSVISCPEPEGDGFSGDESLNGTWEDEWGVIKFNDGNWERSFEQKGTYTTNNNKITIKITHVHGNLFEGENEFGYVFASIWYTKTDLLNIAKNELGSNFNSVKEEIESELNEMFSESPGVDYFVDGNTLILAGDTYTKVSSNEGEKDADIVGTWVLEMTRSELLEYAAYILGITAESLEITLEYQGIEIPSKVTSDKLVFTEETSAYYTIEINMNKLMSIIQLGGEIDWEGFLQEAGTLDYSMDGNNLMYGDEVGGKIKGKKLTVYDFYGEGEDAVFTKQ